jgi:hypothetical protein
MLLPKQVIALGKIVARDARLAYSCIRVERHNGRPRAMATDGRRAVMFAWDEPDASEFPPIEGLSCKPVRGFAANVPARILADAVRGMASRICKPVLNYLLLDESDTSLVRVAAATLDNVTRAQAKANEDAFPPIEDVMPTPARDGTLYDPSRHGNCGFSHVRIGVNARQLADTLQVVADLAGDDENHVVVLTVPVAGNRPIRLDARCPDRRATAVVMPVNFTAYDEEGQPQPPQAAVVLQATAPREAVPVAPEPRVDTPPPLPPSTNRGVHNGLRRSRGSTVASVAPAVCRGGEGPPPVLRRPGHPPARPKRRWWLADFF